MVLPRPAGTKGGLFNPGVAISAMAEANLQGMIYYINHFRGLGAYTRILMLILTSSTKCIISGTWRRLTRTQKYYLLLNQRTGPRLCK